jgi:hypothetical protein
MAPSWKEKLYNGVQVNEDDAPDVVEWKRKLKAAGAERITGSSRWEAAILTSG